MRAGSAALAFAALAVAQTPSPALVPFLPADSEFELVVDASASRTSGLVEALANAPFGPWLRTLGENAGLDLSACERAVLVLAPARATASADEREAEKAPAAWLVLQGTEGLALPLATERLPTAEVGGRPARELSGARAPSTGRNGAAVLVQVADGLLVAGARDEIAARLASAEPARSLEAPASWPLAAGEVVRVRFPIARDAMTGFSPSIARRHAAHGPARGEAVLRWVREGGEEFELGVRADAFADQEDLRRLAGSVELALAGVARDDDAKPLHALLARIRRHHGEQELRWTLPLGESPEVASVVGAVLRRIGAPMAAPARR